MINYPNLHELQNHREAKKDKLQGYMRHDTPAPSSESDFSTY
jgi:hypothetical protein